MGLSVSERLIERAERLILGGVNRPVRAFWSYMFLRGVRRVGAVRR